MAKTGSAYLQSMSQALITEGGAPGEVKYAATLNQGGMNLQVEATMGFPDALTQVIQAPQGNGNHYLCQRIGQYGDGTQ